ncbi:MAG: hypothetical protein WKG07_33990 [Hymenobacter sp.]
MGGFNDRRGLVWGPEHLPGHRAAKSRPAQPPRDGALGARRLGQHHRRNGGQRGLRRLALALVPGKHRAPCFSSRT